MYSKKNWGFGFNSTSIWIQALLFITCGISCRLGYLAPLSLSFPIYKMGKYVCSSDT